MQDKILFDSSNMIKLNCDNNKAITTNDLDDIDLLKKNAFESFKNIAGKGMTGWCHLPYEQEQAICDINEYALKMQAKCDYFVVIGIGGSSLGARAIFDALKEPNHNLLSKEKRNAPMFFSEDNLDPDRLNTLFEIVDLDKTIFNIVSKSGKTIEVLAEFMIIYDAVKQQLGDKANEHFVFTTDKENGYLIEFAKNAGIKCFYVPKCVGGRFSVLSPVGLLPAKMLGLNIEELLQGAKDICESNNEIQGNIALEKAVLEYISYQKGINMNVIMPYCTHLVSYTYWYSQLLAESIGKKKIVNGETINVGITPVPALGVSDQHSQQQLYVDGPCDKVITFVELQSHKTKINIPYFEGLNENLKMLDGVELGQLMNIEKASTDLAIVNSGKMTNTIILPELNEYTLGALFMIGMYEIAYLGELFEINTFDQPGVEESKKSTINSLNYRLIKRN